MVATIKVNKDGQPRTAPALEQSFEMLGLPPLDQAEQEQISTRATQLEQTLAGFKVKAHVRLVQVGPSITTYGLSLQPGVKVSLVRGLEVDLALALGLRAVRLEIPLPGTNLIGVEVANSRRRWVGLDEVVNSSQFDHFAGALKLPVGRDNAGRVVVADLARLPHLVVAGVTGGGKSAFLNSVLTAWTTGLYQPDELRLVLVDPKQVELAKFAQVPHLYLPVITHLTQAQALAASASDTTGKGPNQGQGQDEDRDQAGLLNAITVLGWLVAEMKTRYRRFRAAGVSNLAAYNQLVERLNHQQHSQKQEQEQPQHDQQPNQELEKLPRLVVVVDEIASLMAVINREAEAKVGEYYLKELLNMGRAAGLHLILATQYPSTAVLPGEIKSQIPGRICFAVSREVDSRVVLDQSGAEGLLGRGDMLARLGEATMSASNEIEQEQNGSLAGQSSGGGNELIRAQSVFVSDEEIARRLAALYGDNQGQGNAATNQAEELAATIARLAALPMPSLSDLALELAETTTDPTVSSDQAAQGEIDGEGKAGEEPGQDTTTKRRKGGRRPGNGINSTNAQVVTIPQPQVLVLPPAPAPTPAPILPTVSTMLNGATNPSKSDDQQAKDHKQARQRDQAAQRVSELEQALAQERERAGELEEKLAHARREVDSLRQQIETVSRLKVTLDSGVVVPLPAALAQAELDTLKVGQLVVAESPNSPSQPTPTPALPVSRAQAPAAPATTNNSPVHTQRQVQPIAASSSLSPSRDHYQTDQAYQTMMVDAERRNNKRIEALVSDLVSDLNRLTRSDRAVLLYLSRHQTEEFTTEQLAKKLGYKSTSLANHPPVALVELGLARRWQDYRKEGRRYCNVYVYRAAVEEYLKKHKELDGVTPEQILARLKV